MSILENMLYGVVSGITEFLPISARAHQALIRYLFGAEARVSLQDILVHIGVLLSIFVACREDVARLYRENLTSARTRRKRFRPMDRKSYYDLRLLKTAVFPLITGLILYAVTARFEYNLLVLMCFLTINGLVLLFAEHTRRGNRDARTMSGLDGILIGLAGAASVFPGISRTGMITAYASVRGADEKNATNWAVLLGIPAMCVAICFDVFGMIGGGTVQLDFVHIVGYILAGGTAFIGGYAGISVLRLVLSNSSFSKFAYYSLGTAILSFILYLLT